MPAATSIPSSPTSSPDGFVTVSEHQDFFPNNLVPPKAVPSRPGTPSLKKRVTFHEDVKKPYASSRPLPLWIQDKVTPPKAERKAPEQEQLRDRSQGAPKKAIVHEQLEDSHLFRQQQEKEFEKQRKNRKKPDTKEGERSDAAEGKEHCQNSPPFAASSPINNNAPTTENWDISAIKKTEAMSARPLSPVINPKRKITLQGTRRIVKMTKNCEDDANGIITLDDDEHDLVVENGRKESHLSSSKKRHIELVKGVNVHDYETLEEGEFVNDAIIEFYLNLLFERLDDAKRKDIHIFSSHFYSKLTSKQRKEIGGGDKGPRSKEVRAYELVQKWTKKIDLFSKRLIVFPICEDSHWYVIVVCNPGSIPLSKEERIIRGFPYFLVLDSLGEEHPNAVTALRSYFRLEYQNKNSGKVVCVSKEKVPEKSPEVPMQNNSCDCGVFLLHYIELIFQQPSKFYLPVKINKLTGWFSETDIMHKREHVAKEIQNLARPGTPFPNIRFLQRSSRTVRREKNIAEPPTTPCRVQQVVEDEIDVSPPAATPARRQKPDLSPATCDLSPEDFAKEIITSSGLFRVENADAVARRKRSKAVRSSSEDDEDDEVKCPLYKDPEAPKMIKSSRRVKPPLDIVEVRHKQPRREKSFSESSDSSEVIVDESSTFFGGNRKRLVRSEGGSSSTTFDRTNPFCRNGATGDRRDWDTLASGGRNREVSNKSVEAKNRRFRLVRTNLTPSS